MTECPFNGVNRVHGSLANSRRQPRIYPCPSPLHRRGIATSRGIHYRRCILPVVKTNVWGRGVASIHPQIEISADENCHAEAKPRSALLKLFACLETRATLAPRLPSIKLLHAAGIRIYKANEFEFFFSPSSSRVG